MVDGTDFRTRDPLPRRSTWYAPKFGGAGLRHELATSVFTGDIVHFCGPFAPKANQDITIFRWKLKKMLLPGERVIGDKGYKDPACCTPHDAMNRHHKLAMSRARSRHENANRCLKQWAILRDGFRHHMSKHHLAFRSVLVITQFLFNHGYKKPYELEVFYSDPVDPMYY